jgi:hypothetical protein
MGVRLYNPVTGRFLSVDPVHGGNENAYVYPTDPINKFDLNGKFCWFGKKGRGCRGGGWWKRNGKWVVGGVVAVAGATACGATAGLFCAILAGIAAGAIIASYNCLHDNGYRPARSCGRATLEGAVQGGASGGAKQWRKNRRSSKENPGRHRSSSSWNSFWGSWNRWTL